jgi:hypothetical protein
LRKDEYERIHENMNIHIIENERYVGSASLKRVITTRMTSTLSEQMKWTIVEKKSMETGSAI